ncbi:MAG: hypothetical protein JWQ71_1871 [Pedosphaera sp.]|nr:hypothetical protein [Pedosphaera sp.]
MPLIDFILNIAGLLLWLNWLAINFDPLARATAASLIGTLRKADPSGPKRWKFLAGLLALLYFRAVIYWQLGSAVNWTPRLDLGFVELSFRSDYFGRMLLFSLFSFALTLGIFYLWLILLSAANDKVPDTDPLQKMVRLHLRWIEGWPRVIRILLPFLIGGLLWAALHPLLSRLAIVPPTKSTIQLIEQAALIGIGTYLALKFLIVGILLLHIINSYVYLGNHPFWGFINVTARNLLYPISWLPLQIGRVDFLPLIGIAFVFFVTHLPATKFYVDKLSRFLPF